MIEPKSLISRRYRIGRRLGEGGMAIVYHGSDLLLGREVAIKTLRPPFGAEPALRSRFEREARAAASLSHPNIIDIYDVGEADGAPFIVMELIQGQSLQEIIAADAPFHPDDVAALLAQIGSALDYAHARGYVHRDVKPANILIDPHGRARVADFGIAKSVADGEFTEHGAGFGTAAYVSPEQAAGLMATPASDVYSVGVLAFEMLTGSRPFDAESPLGLAMRHVHDAPPAPSSSAPGLPPQIDAIIVRALDKDPTKRWSTVSGLAEALGNWRGRAVPPSPAPRLKPTQTPTSSTSLAPTIAIVVILALVLAGLIWNGLRDVPEAATDTPARTVLLPPPAITGAVDARPGAAAPEPLLTLPADSAPAIVPSQPEAQVAPTIAPAPAAATLQDTVIVPNLMGLTMSGASQALSPIELSLVPSRPVFSDSIPFNAIAEQSPAPGVTVYRGESIRVSLSRGPSPFASGLSP